MHANQSYNNNMRRYLADLPTVRSTPQQNHRDFPRPQRSSTPNSFSQRDAVTLKEPYFSQIGNGLKTIEGRINSGQFQRLRQGQVITFCNRERYVHCEILAARVYRSFREMLRAEGVEKCLPGVTTVDAGEKIYHDIPSFADRARRSGVVALEIKTIQPDEAKPRNLIDSKEKDDRKEPQEKRSLKRPREEDKKEPMPKRAKIERQDKPHYEKEQSEVK